MVVIVIVLCFGTFKADSAQSNTGFIMPSIPSLLYTDSAKESTEASETTSIAHVILRNTDRLHCLSKNNIHKQPMFVKCLYKAKK